jgi:hypothetical protein
MTSGLLCNRSTPLPDAVPVQVQLRALDVVNVGFMHGVDLL